MSRLMSVAMTADAVLGRRKTVTRRKGWTFVRPGDRITLCRKVRGRKPGEPIERLADVEVVSVRRESLRRLIDPYPHAPWYGSREVEREGFPGMEPRTFAKRFFLDAQGMALDDEVTRIEWRYLDGEESGGAAQG